MAKNENRRSYSSSRPDYNNPPEGKIYIPNALDDDQDLNRFEYHLQYAANGRHIVMHTFSNTPLPCVMELVDDTPENREFKKQYVRMMCTFCKQRERTNNNTKKVEADPSAEQPKEKVYREMARPLSLDKFSDETGEREIDPGTSDSTVETVIVNETVDEMKAEMKAHGEEDYAIFKRHIVGFKQAEISEQLDTPTSTVSDHVKEIKTITAKHRKEMLR